MSGVVAACCLGLAALAVAGCESTQSKSEKLSKQAGKAVAGQKGLSIEAASKTVKVLKTAVLSDRNGTVAVVEVRNTEKRPTGRVPLSIDVTDGKKSLFKNDDPGLEPSLTGVAAMKPGEEIAWVNDQVFAEAKASQVKAVAGASSGPPPAKLPDIEVTKAKLGGDTTSGVAAEGSVRNKSQLEQRNLTLFAVARKDGKVVAAGRGQVERLRVGKSAKYQIFFIGDPRGATIDVTAPPTKVS